MPFPGLKIVGASSPADAYGLIRAGIRDYKPVIVFEHEALLGTKGPLPLGAAHVPAIGGPKVVRQGGDVTIVASLAMVPRALQATEALSHDGIESEVEEAARDFFDGESGS